MKKLALKPELLAVESFPVSDAAGQGGTVVGNEMGTVGISCAPTCPGQLTCGPVDC
ncbi:MAG TPA: hypothetical protein VF665_23220 [Longimicrobium sp.]|jgi:hypothetical protein|uniref:hypothetical protein n=1 Tax=Longimicrobium sp. TaxID=2029185 RepID=UPI002EDAD766